MSEIENLVLILLCSEVQQAKGHISWSASSSLARAAQGRASEVLEDEVFLAASASWGTRKGGYNKIPTAMRQLG